MHAYEETIRLSFLNLIMNFRQGCVHFIFPPHSSPDTQSQFSAVKYSDSCKSPWGVCPFDHWHTRSSLPGAISAHLMHSQTLATAETYSRSTRPHQVTRVQRQSKRAVPLDRRHFPAWPMIGPKLTWVLRGSQFAKLAALESSSREVVIFDIRLYCRKRLRKYRYQAYGRKLKQFRDQS